MDNEAKCYEQWSNKTEAAWVLEHKATTLVPTLDLILVL